MTNHPNRSKVPVFHEGQEVEVACREYRGDMAQGPKYMRIWRRAKILTVSRPDEPPQTVSVIFPDGTSGVFDVEHIRIDTPRGPAAIHPMETLR